MKKSILLMTAICFFNLNLLMSEVPLDRVGPNEFLITVAQHDKCRDACKSFLDENNVGVRYGTPGSNNHFCDCNLKSYLGRRLPSRSIRTHYNATKAECVNLCRDNLRNVRPRTDTNTRTNICTCRIG